MVPDEPRFAPDGRWLLYNAADSGRQEVYLVPAPLMGERWQLSVSGGAQGRFRRDGKEVFYLASTGELMAVELETAAGSSPRIGRHGHCSTPASSWRRTSISSR